MFSLTFKMARRSMQKAANSLRFFSLTLTRHFYQPKKFYLGFFIVKRTTMRQVGLASPEEAEEKKCMKIIVAPNIFCAENLQ